QRLGNADGNAAKWETPSTESVKGSGPIVQTLRRFLPPSGVPALAILRKRLLVVPSPNRVAASSSESIGIFSCGCAFSFTASASQKYRADLVSIRIGSQLCVQRSVTLSGIGAGLCQQITSRTHQPSACNANARRKGTRQRSLGLRVLSSSRFFACSAH